MPSSDHTARNPGVDFDDTWFNNVTINAQLLRDRAANIAAKEKLLTATHRAAFQLRAVEHIDLTTLAADDTEANVSRLCYKAGRPIAPDLLKLLELPPDSVRTAAVCVYPAKVPAARRTLERMGMLGRIHIAAVATGFPTGQYSLATRLDEVRHAVRAGADEIDIVLDRALVLRGEWRALYDEVRAMRDACGDAAHLKAILATGELVDYTNVYAASMVAMQAGADFIKTSTGKEAVNATLPLGVLMSRAVLDYERLSGGYKIGLKPAGGIRTGTDAIQWLILIKDVLGDDWLVPDMFRFGASGLLGDIENALVAFCTGRKDLAKALMAG